MHSVPRGTPGHIAWLLPAGTLFFACGILLGRAVEPWLPLLIPLGLGLFAALLSRKWLRFGAALMLALSAGALLGWHGYHPSLPAEGDHAIHATVVQEIHLREDGQVQTILGSVTLDGTPAADAYWTFYLDEGEALPDWLTPGASVKMTARLYHPDGRVNPGGFNFKEYLLQRDVHFGLYGANDLTPGHDAFSLQGFFASMRHELSLRLMNVMGEEAGAYAAAMLLGTRDFIPEDDRAAFNQLGIAHILSVSGYHVGVLIMLMLLALKRLPIGRRVNFILEIIVLLAYCLLTGGNAPVVRAALLLLWQEFTRLRNRQVVPLHLLCVTALIQLLFNPTLLTGASFQLSYGAMLGLTLVFPWVRKQLPCRTPAGQKLWDAFAAALAAQLGVLLPQLYWFGELPLFAILLNMAVMALACGLMTLYWLTLAALPIPGVRTLLGTAASTATSWMLTAVRMLSSQGFTTIWTRQADVSTLIGWALLILGMSSLLPRRIKRYRRKILIAGVILLGLILFPRPQLSTTYIQFSVGNADAAILQDNDVTVVIDTGEDDQTIASYLHQQRQSVEMLIITHLHIDHAGGIRALVDQEIPVEVCYLPWDAQTPLIDEETLSLIDDLAAAGTELRYLHRGDVLQLPSGSLTVLWPEKNRVSALHNANDVSLVLQAEIAGVSMLLTGDIGSMYEQYVATPADILKAAHHGSASSTSAEFLAAVQPQIILQSNALESREIHMTEAAGDIPLYSTVKHGGITIRFLGDSKFTVQPYQKAP